jgi:hypothetical protein
MADHSHQLVMGKLNFLMGIDAMVEFIFALFIPDYLEL